MQLPTWLSGRITLYTLGMCLKFGDEAFFDKSRSINLYCFRITVWLGRWTAFSLTHMDWWLSMPKRCFPMNYRCTHSFTSSHLLKNRVVELVSKGPGSIPGFDWVVGMLTTGTESPGFEFLYRIFSKSLSVHPTWNGYLALFRAGEDEGGEEEEWRLTKNTLLAVKEQPLSLLYRTKDGSWIIKYCKTNVW